jgi:hypothetical protein
MVHIADKAVLPAYRCVRPKAEIGILCELANSGRSLMPFWRQRVVQPARDLAARIFSKGVYIIMVLTSLWPRNSYTARISVLA